MNNPTVFFDSVRAHIFNGGLSQSQVDGINVITGAWATYGDGDNRKLAYILSTTVRETGGTMQPIEEYGKGRGHAYGLPTGPWHKVYDGNGDVQLTWESNYVKATSRLHAHGWFKDVNLDKNPELARRPDIAAAVLIVGMLEGWFTGRKLSDYVAAGVNYLGARAIVNGTDHAAEIAGNAVRFQAALTAADAAPATHAPAIAPKPPTVAPTAPVPYPPLPRPVPLPPVLPTSAWALLLQAIVHVIAGILAALPRKA